MKQREAEAALSALEDLNRLARVAEWPGNVAALEARIATMNAEAGRVLAEDLGALMYANVRGFLDDE
jgi:hypothetical protein